MFGIVITVDTNLRQIQPVIGRDRGDIPAAVAQSLAKLGCHKSFAARIDSGNSNQKSSLHGRNVQTRTDNPGHRFVECVVVAGGVDPGFHLTPDRGPASPPPATASQPPVAWIGIAFSVIHTASALGLSLPDCLGSVTDPVQRFASCFMSISAKLSAAKSWRNLRPLFSPRFTSDSRSLPRSATFNARPRGCGDSATKVALTLPSSVNVTRKLPTFFDDAGKALPENQSRHSLPFSTKPGV